MSDTKIYTVTNTITAYDLGNGQTKVDNTTEFNFDIPKSETQEEEYEWVSKQNSALQAAYFMGRRSRMIQDEALDRLLDVAGGEIDNKEKETKQ